MVSVLVDRFHQKMISVYRRAKNERECHYNANRFLRMVTEQGGLQTTKTLLQAEGYSEGLTALWKLDRLDITMEATVIQQQWSQLFTEAELLRLGEGCVSLDIKAAS